MRLCYSLYFYLVLYISWVLFSPYLVESRLSVDIFCVCFVGLLFDTVLLIILVHFNDFLGNNWTLVLRLL